MMIMSVTRIAYVPPPSPPRPPAPIPNLPCPKAVHLCTPVTFTPVTLHLCTPVTFKFLLFCFLEELLSKKMYYHLKK